MFAFLEGCWGEAATLEASDETSWKELSYRCAQEVSK